MLERFSKFFSVSVGLRLRPASSACINNLNRLLASASLRDSSSPRLKTKVLSRTTLLNRTLILMLAAAAVAGLFRPAFAQHAPGPSDEQARRAIDRSVEYLWSHWNDQHCWEIAPQPAADPRDHEHHTNYGGRTALIAGAMLAGGVSQRDPRMAKTIEWLSEQPMQGTYALAFRAQVWAQLPREPYHRLLAADVMSLMQGMQFSPMTGGSPGAFGYVSGRQQWDNANAWQWDNSNSQLGVLGVWSGWREGVDVPAQFWQKVQDHWSSRQNSDGGWGYRTEDSSYGSMTAGGLASLYICIDALYSREFVNTGRTMNAPPLQAAMQWLENNFRPDIHPGYARDWSTAYFYYLYAVERAGHASGRKHFGNIDWYMQGAQQILSRQLNDGGMGNPIDTAFALLFLSRGRQPVLLNHLQYDGDWQNRPRALANLTRYLSRTFEREVHWQIINLQAPVADWHDAPILVISGARTPTFSDNDIARLRQYVLQGGTILSIVEGGGAAFTAGMRTAYAKMFPEYALKDLEQDHPLRESHFRPRRRLNVAGVSNGVRLLALHVRDDLPRTWQINQFTSGRADFEHAANIYFHLTDKGNLRYRGETHWPALLGRPTVRTVPLARIQHSGQWDPEPIGWERFAILLANETGAKLEVKPLRPDQLDPAAHPVAHLTGTDALAFTDADKAALKAYCLSGGTLIIDAGGGNPAFRAAAESLLTELFDRSPRPLPPNADLYKLPGREIERVAYRRDFRARYGTQPRLQAVAQGDTLLCLYSAEDISAGLVGYQREGIDGYAPSPDPARDSAYQIMRNIVLWAAAKDN